MIKVLLESSKLYLFFFYIPKGLSLIDRWKPFVGLEYIAKVILKFDDKSSLHDW